MNAEIIVSQTDGGAFVSDFGTVKYQIEMRVQEEIRRVNAEYPSTGETEDISVLDIGNFGWNIRAFGRRPHVPYKHKHTMRSAITRILRNRGYNIVKWEWED